MAPSDGATREPLPDEDVCKRQGECRWQMSAQHMERRMKARLTPTIGAFQVAEREGRAAETTPMPQCALDGLGSPARNTPTAPLVASANAWVTNG